MGYLDGGDPGELSMVTVDGEGPPLAYGFAYTASGALRGYTMGNDVRYDLDLSPGNRIRRITAARPMDGTPSVLDLTYAFDSTGNITDISDALDAAGSSHYEYDLADRLAAAFGRWGSLAWSYDANGNRLSEERASPYGGSATLVFAYEPGTSRLVSVSPAGDGAAPRVLEHDASGNVTRWDDVAIDYDAAERAIRYRDRSSGVVLAANEYDDEGRRVRREGAETCRSYAHDVAGRLLGEYDCATDEPLTEYVYGPGSVLLAIRTGGVWYWPVADHLGTVQKVLASAGNIVWEGHAEPFGRTDVVVESIRFDLRFPGQIADAEGLPVLNGARLYDPASGRYLQPDPVRTSSCGRGDPGSYSYTYADGNPLRYTDPLGRYVVVGDSCGTHLSRALGLAMIAISVRVGAASDEECSRCPRALDAYDAVTLPRSEEHPVIEVRCTPDTITSGGEEGCGSYDCGDPASPITLYTAKYPSWHHKYPDCILECFLHELTHVNTCDIAEEPLRAGMPCARRMVFDAFRSSPSGYFWLIVESRAA